MPDCSSIDPLVTPYVDEQLPRDERERVDAHVRVCPPCRARVAIERAVRDLMRTHAPHLSGERAPVALRAAVDAAIRSAVVPGPAPRAAWQSRLSAFALAATLVFVVGSAFVYEATAHSSRVMAAELTADHVKCFAMNQLLGTHDEPGIVESAMRSEFDWPMQISPNLRRVGLELIGSRPCLYGEGKVAHIMCRHNGQPVSIFMLPQTVRADEIVEVMGHEAKIWSAGGRTFVLITQEPRREVEQMASVVEAALR